MNKLKSIIEWVWAYRFLCLIVLFSILAYFYTEHEEITFADSINMIIAIILGYISIKTDQLISSDEIRATYCLTSGINDNLYISEIILENKRNKPIPILALHIQLGNNYALKLIEYDAPFILQPLITTKIKLDPVTIYLIGCGLKVNLNEEFEKDIEKTLIITSTDRFIKVKYFKKCPNFINKVLNEQPFAEIYPYREYWDKENKEIKDINTRFRVKITNTNNKCIDIVYIKNNNILYSNKISSIQLKQSDTENLHILEQKIREILPFVEKDSNIEILENKICLLSQFKIEEKKLKYYNYFQTKIYNYLYKIYNNWRKKKIKKSNANK